MPRGILAGMGCTAYRRTGRQGKSIASIAGSVPSPNEAEIRRCQQSLAGISNATYEALARETISFPTKSYEAQSVEPVNLCAAA